MTRLRWKRIALLVLCAGLSALWGQRTRPEIRGGIRMVDFGEIYYGARCARHHQDTYDPNVVLREFKAEGGSFPTDGVPAKVAPIIVSINVNLPTALFLIAPFAMLPWAVAQTLWTILTIALLVLAGYLVWSLSDNTAPALSGFLICLALANCEQLLAVGNVAGIAVGLCIVACWCFLQQRCIAGGVVLLAISLALKPHDAGFVWLYFLLAGGAMRKRAVYTLAAVGILAISAAIWIAPASPHWLRELHANHVTVSNVGGTSDPALSGVTSGNVGSIIDLQAALSVFAKDPHFYNWGSYLIIGPLILMWSVAAVGRRVTPETAQLAVAAIAVLSLLPVYHRPYDAKLLMLTIPACAMLWAEGGARRWLALALTGTGIFLTSDIPLALLVSYSKTLFHSAFVPADKAVTASLLPPLALLATGIFYLVAYIRYGPKLNMHIHDHVAVASTNTVMERSNQDWERAGLTAWAVNREQIDEAI